MKSHELTCLLRPSLKKKTSKSHAALTEEPQPNFNNVVSTI